LLICGEGLRELLVLWFKGLKDAREELEDFGNDAVESEVSFL